MAQVTIYLDKELEKQVREAAAASGRSLSAYIGDLLRGKPTSPSYDYLPEDFWEKFGTIEDFPLAEEIRALDRPAPDRVDP